MIEAPETETGSAPRSGEGGRRALLLLFLLLTLANIHALPGQIYVQFLFLVALFGLYFMDVALGWRLWRMTPGLAMAMALVFFSFFLSFLIRGLSVQAFGCMLKYFLALASFPILGTYFEGLTQRARNQALYLYGAAIFLFTLATEWSRLLGMSKPELQFLGGYNGANLHYLTLTAFFLIRSLFQAGTRGWKILQSALAGGFIVLMLATQSRQSIIFILFVLGFLLLAMRRQGRLSGRHFLPLTLGGAALVGIVLSTKVIDRFVYEAQAFSTSNSISSVERYLMLVQFWQGLDFTRVMTGFGFDAVVQKIEGTSDSIHLGYLQLIFNGGLILFAGFAAFVWIYVRKHSSPGGPRRMMMGVFLLANLFDAHLISFQVLWLPALVLALFPDRFPEAEARPRNSPERAV